MLGKAVTIVAALAASLGAPEAGAQDTEVTPTAEQMIEVTRETWGMQERRCPAAQPGEIVVCSREEEEPRVESPTDEAIRTGQAMPDGIPRAPNVFGLPPCRAYTFCGKVGRTPEPPLLIDLAALPHPLTPEEAAHVFRAEDMPEGAVTPEAASPAAVP